MIIVFAILATCGFFLLLAWTAEKRKVVSTWNAQERERINTPARNSAASIQPHFESLGRETESLRAQNLKYQRGFQEQQVQLASTLRTTFQVNFEEHINQDLARIVSRQISEALAEEISRMRPDRSQLQYALEVTQPKPAEIHQPQPEALPKPVKTIYDRLNEED